MLTITTCRTYPQPPQNLLPLAAELEKRGIPTSFRPWQDAPDTPFILPLCAWDYAETPQDFAAWIRSAAARGQRFSNPPGLMLWNMDKRYLTDLSERGINAIESIYMPSESTGGNPDPMQHYRAIQQIMQRQGWREAVVKPAVGQSGKGVCKIRLHQTGTPDAILPPDAPHSFSDGLIIQPYIRQIEHTGETSLVFFNGRFSHAVCRRPPKGEWRANSAYGAVIRPVHPPDFAVANAQAVLHTLPHIPPYARVDGIITGGIFLLNELELIEPALYLHTCAQAAARFAESITAQIIVK